jgi:hypothetical protein
MRYLFLDTLPDELMQSISNIKLHAAHIQSCVRLTVKLGPADLKVDVKGELNATRPIFNSA